MADQMTDSFYAHKDDAAILERQARNACSCLSEDSIVHDVRYGCELLIRILTHLFARMSWFVELTCLVVADIIVLLLHNLGVVVEVVEVLHHLSTEPNALNFVFVQLS